MVTGASLVEVTKPCTTFTCFERLEPKLQIKIWERVCQQPRVVDVRIKIVGDKTLFWGTRAIEQNTSDALYKIASTDGIPSILHVSAESRLGGLKRYSLAF